MSSFAYNASIFGISIASVFGVYKTLDYCKRLRYQAAWRLQEVTELRQAVERKDAEIYTLRQRLENANTEAHEKDQTILGLRRQLEGVKQELEDMGAGVDVYRSRNLELDRHLESLKKELKDREAVIAGLSRRGSGNGEPSLLGRDRYSVTDLTTMIQKLNAEILQMAGSMAELFEHAGIIEEQDENDEDMQVAYNQATEVLGSRMVNLLRMDSYRSNRTILQFAFQACMSAFSDWMISSWYFEDPKSEQVLTGIYEQMKEWEDQAIAGQWRVLTRVHVQNMVQDKPDIAEYFVDAFSSILVAVGFKGSQANLHDLITQNYQDQMVIIGKLALDLNKAIGEGIISSEVDPIYVAPDVSFDPSVMNDVLEEETEETEQGANVLCTTELGLLWASKNSEGRWEEKILLRPRVVREPGLKVLISA